MTGRIFAAGIAAVGAAVGAAAPARKAKRPFSPLGSAAARDVAQRNIRVYLKLESALPSK